MSHRSADKPATRHVSYCRICEQLCGIVVDVSDGEVIRIRGDILHPVSDGYICPKGATMGQVQADPDRVRHPLRRTANGVFEEVDWDTALDDIAARLRRLRHDHGPDAIAMYMGNPAAFSLSHLFWAKGLIDAIGSKHFYSAISQDNGSRSAASQFQIQWAPPTAQLTPREAAHSRRFIRGLQLRPGGPQQQDLREPPCQPVRRHTHADHDDHTRPMSRLGAGFRYPLADRQPQA